jgi:hypothetical protein
VTLPGFRGVTDGERVLPVTPDHSNDALLTQLGIAKKADPPTNSGFVTSDERQGRGALGAQVHRKLQRRGVPEAEQRLVSHPQRGHSQQVTHVFRQSVPASGIAVLTRTD